jgi:release factor glutamine methyltransferase
MVCYSDSGSVTLTTVMKIIAFFALLPRASAFSMSTSLFRFNLTSMSRRSLSTRSTVLNSRISWDGETNVKLKDAYSNATSYLEENGVPESDISARMMVCDITKIGYRMSDFNKNQEIVLSQAQLTQLSEYCQLRKDRIPLQYVIGNWDFYGFTVLCKPPVLIPRPETEELVERILKEELIQKLKRPSRILDVGAGTGVIGIALLSQLPTATCDALDINDVAVALANDNANLVLKKNPQRYQCKLQSFVDFVKSSRGAGCYDIIVSNPPYIPSKDMADLEPEVVKFEDSLALDGGLDGLDMVRDLILNSWGLLNPLGSRELWIEVSNTHPAVIEKWMQTAGPHSDDFDFIEGITDFAGNPRFVRLRAKLK